MKAHTSFVLAALIAMMFVVGITSAAAPPFVVPNVDFT